MSSSVRVCGCRRMFVKRSCGLRERYRPHAPLEDQASPWTRIGAMSAGAVDESEALAMRNLAAALFRLEKSRAPQDLRVMVGALVDWLHGAGGVAAGV